MSAFSDILPFINGLGLVSNLREIELGRFVIGFARGVVAPLLTLTRVSYC